MKQQSCTYVLTKTVTSQKLHFTLQLQYRPRKVNKHENARFLGPMKTDKLQELSSALHTIPPPPKKKKKIQGHALDLARKTRLSPDPSPNFAPHCNLKRPWNRILTTFAVIVDLKALPIAKNMERRINSIREFFNEFESQFNWKANSIKEHCK